VFGKKIKIDNDLYAKLEAVGQEVGYSSTDEFIVHVLQLAVERIDDDADEKAVEQQLRGLGYIE
jgi:metal-responsive CopG/Arc/MetJ family transcriptional regulator